MKQALLSLLLLTPMFGQIVHLKPSDPIAGSQVIINSNFDYLERAKIPFTSGTAAPSGACPAGMLYLQADTSHSVYQLYMCGPSATWNPVNYMAGADAARPVNCALNQVYLATDVATMSYCSVAGNPGTWTTIGASTTPVIIPCTSSPTINFAAGTVFQITLSCTVGSMSILNLTNRTVASVRVCQDGTGNHPFPWAAAFHGAMAVGQLASTCSEQVFHSTDGVSLYSQSLPVVNQQ